LAEPGDASPDEDAGPDELVIYRIDGPVAVITLNRPDRLNALLPGMGRAYAEGLRRAEADPAVRAIVVTGAGRGFCAGADLSVLAQGPDALMGYLQDERLEDLPTVALHIDKPVVTAINGPCAGIGFVLAVAADVRFASPTATLSTSFSRLGLVAEYGIAWLLPRLVGMPAATEILLSGRTLSADEAHRLGLVHAVAEDPLVQALAWAHEVAANCSPSSLRAIKSQLLQAATQGLDTSVSASLRMMAESFREPDLAEALVARSERRPAHFEPLPRTPSADPAN
jgi:enoyl-CoA hydratase/carnithine racemase